MKNCILIIVLLFFAKPIFPVLDFVINYDAIQELCVNKNRPELECNGSCHLKNELAKTAQDENPFSAKKTFQTQLEVLFFNQYDWSLAQVIQQNYSIEVADSYSSDYYYLPTLDLVKPPLV
ncbi:hypothetical protein HX017_15845 [Myroides marinus]|uniref:Uncharacterized protein n=1 Tax=Myroides marinus TaxID=703342 RepID=A0A1H6WUF0_9FLAO|nr:hypothetical protein [Myroides marinus]MDR0194237.1 hypothetical protein [Myroides sp.]MDM1348555.1 hypothetical protein [Myroides marinus]MDM1352028.1 hypothetical protein [Myroides marinus]MDM1355636.1 hypothetical protein [Myroides marinus]MDM1359266.1 hypothetical protein [Myroides marinus]